MVEPSITEAKNRLLDMILLLPSFLPAMATLHGSSKSDPMEMIGLNIQETSSLDDVTTQTGCCCSKGVAIVLCHIGHFFFIVHHGNHFMIFYLSVDSLEMSTVKLQDLLFHGGCEMLRYCSV